MLNCIVLWFDIFVLLECVLGILWIEIFLVFKYKYLFRKMKLILFFGVLVVLYYVKLFVLFSLFFYILIICNWVKIFLSNLEFLFVELFNL